MIEAIRWFILKHRLYRWIPGTLLKVKILTWALPLGEIRTEDLRWANEQIARMKETGEGLLHRTRYPYRRAGSDMIEIRRNEDDSIDEIVAEGKIHLEQMDSGQWWMSIEDGNERTSLNFFSNTDITCYVQEYSSERGGAET